MSSQIDKYKDVILEVLKRHDVKRASLFGSIVRGEMSPESDIDIFVDTKKNIGKDVDKLLVLFRRSRLNEIWEMKGIKNGLFMVFVALIKLAVLMERCLHPKLKCFVITA